MGKPEEYLAIDHGILVKCGRRFRYRRGTQFAGPISRELKKAVERQFRERAEREKAARALEAKLEADLVRGLLEAEKHA